MISLTRVYAIFLRHSISIRSGDVWRIVDCLFWPCLNVLNAGTIVLMAQHGGQSTDYFRPYVAAVALMTSIFGANNEISTALLEENWDSNLVNLFSTPLHFIEWMMGVMGLGIVRAFISVVSAIVLSILFFNINIMAWPLFLFSALLIMNGWFTGLMSGALIIYYGNRVAPIAWIGAWVLAPLCGIYCPIELFHPWVQAVARTVPSTYVFEAVRCYYWNGILDGQILGVAFVLSLVYLAIGFVFFRYMFEKKRIQGLQKS